MTTRAIVLINKGLYLEALVDILREIDPSMVVDTGVPATASDLDAVDAAKPDVVIVDVDQDGEDAVAIVRAVVQRLGGARVVAVGNDGNNSSIEQFLSVGAAGFLPKSFMRLATLAVLRLALGVPPAPVETNAGGHPSPRAPLGDFGLTDREIEVLALVVQGKTNAAIAQVLGTAEGTVRIQMSSILSKLGVSNRAEAISLALRMDRIVWEQIRKAEAGNLDLGWLLPYMEHRAHKAKHVLFQKNDIGDELYYVQNGRVLLPELGVEMKEKELFGELGMFAASRRRTSSAICATDVDLFVLNEVDAKRLYFQNPAFAIFMMNLVAQRLVAARQSLPH